MKIIHNASLRNILEKTLLAIDDSDETVVEGLNLLGKMENQWE
jgi:hypothetical protein